MALQLNRYEMLHLYTLADHRQPVQEEMPDLRVDRSVQRMLDKLEPFPAYVRGPRWDTLAWNNAACELYGDFNRMNVLERNSLWRMFVRSDYPDLLPDWPNVAQILLAQFRTSYGQHIGDPAFEALVDLLKKSSEKFAQWWENHEVQGIPLGLKRFNHPKLGELVFEHQSLTVADHPDLKMTVYIPVEADRLNEAPEE